MITRPSFFLQSGRFFLIALFAPLALSAQTRQADQDSSDARRVASVAPDNYKITGGDKLLVTIHDEEELSREAHVNQDGQISLLLLGNVRVSGMPAQQAAEVIKKAYIDAEILKRPSVTVSVATFSLKSVNVIGKVNKPGPVVFADGQESIDLIEAIAAAGDFASTAKKSKVQIRRNNRTYEVNVDDMIEGKTNSIRLLPGDVISVPQRVF